MNGHNLKKLGVLIATLLIITFITTLPAAAQSEGQIGGVVYIDINGNGIREQGEDGVKNVEITYDSGGWNTTISTADDGTFSLGVNPATWTVSILVPDGYTTPQVSKEVFIENPGDVVNNVEFGLIAQTGSGDGDGDGDILPESGGVISGSMIVAGLVSILLVGAGMVVYGQRKVNQDLPA